MQERKTLPEQQGCCGALLSHAGEERAAITLAKKMIDAFTEHEVDFIITNAGGCGSAVKEYAHLLRDAPTLPRTPIRLENYVSHMKQTLSRS